MEETLVDRICDDLHCRLMAAAGRNLHYELFIDKDKGNYIIFTANALGEEFIKRLP